MLQRPWHQPNRCRPREGGDHNHQGFGYRWALPNRLLRRMGPPVPAKAGMRGAHSGESLLHMFGSGDERNQEAIAAQLNSLLAQSFADQSLRSEILQQNIVV